VTTAAPLVYEPDSVLPPGETLLEVLDERAMTQAELALRTGLSTKHVNQIAKGAASVTAETAVLLERATGVSANVWLRLESAYQVARSLEGESARLEDDLDWLDQVPVLELKRRGYLTGSSDRIELLREVLTFFGVSSLSSWQAVWQKPTAYRRSKAFVSDPGATAAWLRIGEIQAAEVATNPYDRSALLLAIPRLRDLTTVDDPAEWFTPLRQMLADVGVALAVEPEIKGARVVGATRWLTPDKAMIQLSLRHKWSDVFWFTLFHEIGHLMLHSKKDVFINDQGPHSGEESEADAFASQVLIPRTHEDRLADLATEDDVRAFAAEIGIGPAIVVGRLQHDQRWPYSKGNGMRPRLVFAQRGR
jgi:HTH-type transcriptional regulator/antitoxin HigA